MEQAPLISIIMPVYNAGVLLHTAVESVLRQSFADFELLLVDDGSTDGSAALAHELAKKDGRIRVLEQPNAGICAARNLGLQHCRGQWFTFCDDDDTMLPHDRPAAPGVHIRSAAYMRLNLPAGTPPR